MEEKNRSFPDKTIVLEIRDSRIEISKSPFSIQIETTVDGKSKSIYIPKSMINEFIKTLEFIIE